LGKRDVLVLAAKAGLSIDMSQTNEQEQGADPAKPRARKDWEWFWRIIAGLMLVIIAWTAWVLYQITPRSVVTPLVYESQAKPVATHAPATGAAAGASSQPAAVTPSSQQEAAALPVTQPTPEAAAAASAMDEAQAAARSGAHPSSADVQAAALEKREEQLRREEQLKRERLKLSTEIATPPTEQEKIPKQPESKADGTPAIPAATGASGKARPKAQP